MIMVHVSEHVSPCSPFYSVLESTWRGQGQQGWCADRKPGWQPACPVEEYSDETDDFAHAIVDPRLAVFTDTSVRSARCHRDQLPLLL